MAFVQEKLPLVVVQYWEDVVRKVVNVCPPNQRFTPEDRLRTKRDFQQVFQGDRVGSRQFVLYYRQAPQAKLGIIISKKNIKHASDRNRVKRVAREWFRRQEVPSLELVFIGNKASNSLTNKEIRQCLDQLLERALKPRAKRWSGAYGFISTALAESRQAVAVFIPVALNMPNKHWLSMEQYLGWLI